MNKNSIVVVLVIVIIILGAGALILSNLSVQQCIITVGDEKYDVTELTKSHPGGNIYECGTDMTSIYVSQHGTDTSRIQQYKIIE